LTVFLLTTFGTSVRVTVQYSQTGGAARERLSAATYHF
jgi:hypothetical protein